MHHLGWTIAFWIAAGMLLYIHVGYFSLLLLLGRLRKRPTHVSENLPRVSLIIPAHNEEKVLAAKLDNALAIDYPKDLLEIIVASDGSIDRTTQIAAAYADRGVRLLAFTERRGKASVLNDAAATATGDVLCLCDANVMFRPDTLRLLVERLADSKVGAVSGDVRLASHESNFGQGESFYYLLEKRLQEAESNLGSLIGVDGGMYVLRRALFRALPPDTILDDFVLSMQVIRQGSRVVYEPRAVAVEGGTPLAAQEYRRRVRVSAGAVQSLKRGQFPSLLQPIECWQYTSHKLLRWLAPFWLIDLFVANVVLCSAGWFYCASLIGQAAFYVLALAALISLRVRATRAGGIAFYFTMSHVAMAVGSLKGLLNRQKVTWAQADRGALRSPCIPMPPINVSPTAAMTGAIDINSAGPLSVMRDADPQAWDAFLAQRGGSLTHERTWDNVFGAYRLKVQRLAAFDRGRIVGILPLVLQSSSLFGRRLVSLPWFDSAGVLSDNAAARNALLAEAKVLSAEHRAGELHLRQPAPVPGWPEPRTDKMLLSLPLDTDPDRLWANFNAKVRNQVRKAEKEGLAFESGGAELLGDFFRIYSINMRDLGSPSHSLPFFRAVLAAFPSAARVHLVRLGREVIGAGVTLRNGQAVEIPWASSLRRYNSYCVNHLLYWNLLRQACLDGQRVFHFGRSTLESGTYRFKKQWGAEATALYWYSFRPDGQPLAADTRPEESFSLARRAWQRLPVWLARRLGPMIIRNVA